MVAVHQEAAEARHAVAHVAVSEVRLGVADEEAPSGGPSVGEAAAEVLLGAVGADIRRTCRIFEHCRGVQALGYPGTWERQDVKRRTVRDDIARPKGKQGPRGPCRHSL